MKTKAQHTPSPWKCTDEPTDSCCWAFHVESVEREGDSKYPKYHVADVSTEADARLIAACPELLEALKALVNDISNGTGIDLDNVTSAEAAIAKAEGK